MKLIGPELTQIFSEPEDETEQMLADDIPRYERAPLDEGQGDTMPQALGSLEGRSQGGNELPPMRARDPLENRKGEREMASR